MYMILYDGDISTYKLAKW